MNERLAALQQLRADAIAKRNAITNKVQFEGRAHLTSTETINFKRACASVTELDAEIADLRSDIERSGRGNATAAHIARASASAGTKASTKRDTGNTERSTAMRSLERQVKEGKLPAEAAETVESMLDAGTAFSQSWTARWAAAAGSAEYTAAFGKLVANPVQGHLRWTPQEADAFRKVEGLRDEMRAMGLTDSAGGYMVPTHLDPAILLTNSGSINPLRQISRNVTISTDEWHGVSSAGVTAEWIAEAAEMADASPTLDNPSIPVHKADAFVPFSFEVEGDAASFMDELRKLLIDGAEQLTATAFTTGTGTGQPTGVITALDGTASEVSPTVVETLSAADVYKTQNALPPRFQPRASWTANLAILNTIRQFETTNGALKFPELAGNPPMLLSRGVYENSNMDGAINPAATADNFALLYGDFSQFVIVNRIGSTLELVPHLFGTNRRPTGQRGALLWFRTGSDVVVPEAFRLLNVATTA